MNLNQWDPFERLEQFRQQSNRMMNELLEEMSELQDLQTPIAFQPEVDLVETPDDFRFYLSIPGLIEDDLVIHVDGHRLTIRGERHAPYDMEARQTQLREWRYGYFERRFELPAMVEVTSIRAGYDAGVLTIVARKLNAESQQAGGSR